MKGKFSIFWPNQNQSFKLDIVRFLRYLKFSRIIGIIGVTGIVWENIVIESEFSLLY